MKIQKIFLKQIAILILRMSQALKRLQRKHTINGSQNQLITLIYQLNIHYAYKIQK
jgi:hypothetical protein